VNTTQIFLSTKDKDDRPDMPWQLKDATYSVKELYEDTQYTFYDNEAVEDFLNEEYGDEVLNAYNRLQPLAYKCDLARYCILLKKGGWYFDVGLTAIERYDFPHELCAFRSVPRYSHVGWSCDNGLMYVKEGHVALQIAINNVLSSVRDQYYGFTPLCPTGPSLWGRSVAESIGTRKEPDQMYLFGDCMELTPHHPKTNKAFVLPNGVILAECKPSEGGDLTEMGAADTNNYNYFWHRKLVYA